MNAHALALLLLLSSFPLAQENRDDLTPVEVSYVTTVEDDLSGYRIEMLLDHVRRPTIHIAMPDWSPGAYRIGTYGKGVRNFRAEGSEGAELDVVRMDPGSWSIRTDGHEHIHVSYEVSASSRRSRRRENAPEVTGLRLSGPRTYAYLRDADVRNIRSRYVLPEGWRVANGLIPTLDPDVRLAKDYDTFIDAPTTLGEFIEREFEINGTPFRCVFFENAQEYDFDVDAFVDIVRKIVVNQGALYGSYPFPNYVFLFHLPGGGGLEHLNSTTIGLRANSQRDDPSAGASVTSHEFFHTWNVKRIRPRVLGPFDYDRENYTGNLWVSEGWTSYMGDLTLVRADVWSRERYLEHLQRIISSELNKERRAEHSVFWASRNAWHRFNDEEGSRVDYYDKGEILGALIDLKIRHETGDRKSLNDVMRFLNRWFAEENVGFEEHDIERACTSISNHDFSEFFARHVYGVLDPPIAEVLSYAGIAYETEVIPCGFPFIVRGKRIFLRRGEEPSDENAPRRGDSIVAIDGEPFEDADEVLRRHAPGDKVLIELEREDETREVEVELTDRSRMIPTLRYMDRPTPEQLALRERWLTSTD